MTGRWVEGSGKDLEEDQALIDTLIDRFAVSSSNEDGGTGNAGLKPQVEAPSVGTIPTTTAIYHRAIRRPSRREATRPRTPILSP
jgi:hypothetical protein